MSLQKIKDKNPEFILSASASKKASDAVIQTSLKSQLDMVAYNQKYTGKASSNTNPAGIDVMQKAVQDQDWKFLKKISANQNIDFLEEPKGSFFDKEGNEMAAED